MICDLILGVPIPYLKNLSEFLTVVTKSSGYNLDTQLALEIPVAPRHVQLKPTTPRL